MVADVIVNADDRAASNNLGNRGWRVKRPSDGKLRRRLVVRSREPIARLIENRLLIAVIMNNSRPCRKGITQCVCHRAIAGMTETRDYRNRFPVLFVGHGTPLNAISDNIFTQTWARLGQTIRPRAILSISAHWYTRGTRVTAVERPPTIYDFGYRNLRHLSYPAELLQPAAVVNDEQWGFRSRAQGLSGRQYPRRAVKYRCYGINALSLRPRPSPQAPARRGGANNSVRQHRA